MKNKKVTLLQPELEIRMKTDPGKNNFKRFLLFRDYDGNRSRVPVKFKKKKDLIYHAAEWPEGYDKLKAFMQDGNRSYWDEMWLENRRGKVSLDIGRVKFRLPYGGVDGKKKKTFEIINRRVNKVLSAGMSKVNLNPASIATKYQSANVNLESPAVLRSALRDLGKYGTDRLNGSPKNINPKFGKGVEQGNAEFVAWYFHDERVKAGRYVFDREKYGADVPEFFRKASRLCSWSSSKKGFVNDKSKKSVSPKPGDFLQNKKTGESSIVVQWDAKSKKAIVIYGPKPVTTKELDFSKLSKDSSFSLGTF